MVVNSESHLPVIKIPIKSLSVGLLWWDKLEVTTTHSKDFLKDINSIALPQMGRPVE